MAKTFTSTEVKRRYNDKTYKRIAVYFRYDEDRDLIQFLEDNKENLGTTNIFRDALEMYIKANSEG